VAAAHARNIHVVLDNTWSAGILLDAFAHGVDITMQAVTKYIGGHSDLLLGSVTVRDDALYDRLGSTQQNVGFAVSPDDCSLALRGLQTLAVRLSYIETSAFDVASWLAARPEVETVLHPALPSCPGHEFWKRDFQGSSGVFSVVFKPGPSQQQIYAFVDALHLFKVGYSWAGVTSLAVAYDIGKIPGRPPYEHRIVRFNIGLESTSDLTADLDQANCDGNGWNPFKNSPTCCWITWTASSTTAAPKYASEWWKPSTATSKPSLEGAAATRISAICCSKAQRMVVTKTEFIVLQKAA